MEKKPNIHAGHRQRLKKLFLKTGGFYMEDHQLLELALFYSVPRRDTNPLAHQLLDRFGSLSGVFRASPEALLEEKGVSENTVALLKLFERFLIREKQDRSRSVTYLKSLSEVEEFFQPFFLDNRDKIYLLSLNDKGRVLALDYQDGMGSDCPLVDIRTMVTEAAQTCATRMVLAIPRTGQMDVPSASDVADADRCELALGALTVRLWDVLLYNGERFISLRRCRVLH